MPPLVLVGTFDQQLILRRARSCSWFVLLQISLRALTIVAAAPSLHTMTWSWISSTAEPLLELDNAAQSGKQEAEQHICRAAAPVCETLA